MFDEKQDYRQKCARYLLVTFNRNANACVRTDDKKISIKKYSRKLENEIAAIIVPQRRSRKRMNKEKL